MAPAWWRDIRGGAEPGRSRLRQDNPPNDGFDEYADSYPESKTALANVLAANDPLAVERVLALSAGDVSGSDTWDSLEQLDSCTIGREEVMRRLSVVSRQ